MRNLASRRLWGRVVWGMVLVFVAASVGNCRGRGEVPKVLRVWAMGKEGEYLAATVHGTIVAGCRVEVQRLPWSAAHEKLLTAFVAGTLPDVIQLGSTWVPEFAAVGAIACGEVSDWRERDLFPGALDTVMIDGRMCAVPWYVDTRVLFYRRDLLERAGFQQPPRTWQEWRQAMQKVGGLGAGHYGLLAPLDEWQLLVALALQVGASLLRENETRGNFQSEPFRRAFSFYVSLFRDGLAPFTGEAQVANVYQDFAAGLFTFYVTGPWNLGEFRRRLPPELQESWATALLPVPDPALPSVSVMGGASLAVVRSSAHPEAARELIAGLLQPAEQVRFYRTTGDLPVLRTAWEDPGLQTDSRLTAFRLQLENARPTPKVPEWERIAGLLVQYTELVVRERLSAEAALARLDAEADRVLEKRRWLLQRTQAAE